jgi:Zn-dependent protease with chaperone function
MEELGLQGLVRVVDLPHPTAFCYGLLRPRICLSSALVLAMSPPQLRAILLHERLHLKRWHPLITLVLDTLADALFFLPLVGELRDQFEAKMELDADRAAIHGAGRKPLAGALHRLLTHPQPLIRQSGLILNSLSVTQARLDQLLEGKPLGWQPSLTGLASIAPAISLMCLLLMSTAG